MTTARWRRADTAVCLVLATVSAVYLTVRPWPLGASDEGYYYYHAVRMLQGEALYRDVSELTTPLLMDLLALAFRGFGATITTGRAVGTALHALLVPSIYAGARASGAAPLVAIAAALVHLAFAQPAWPYTTPHWLAVLLVCVLLLIGLDRRRARTLGWTAAQGVLLGLLVATRQHAGIATAAGVGFLALADHAADRLWGRAPGPALGRQLATLAATIVVGTALVMGIHVARAGASPVVAQLVLQPLTGYRALNQFPWGANTLLELAPFTCPPLLFYLPLVIPLAALRAAVAWVDRWDRRTAERLLVLAVFGGAAIAFTMHLPDLIHLAMIMPVVLILAAELATSLLHTVAPRARLLEAAVGLAVILACTVQLERNLAGARARYPIVHQTTFGPLRFATPADVADMETIRRAVEPTPGRDLLCYPGCASVHLMIGARNPTRHDLAFPTYQRDEEIQGMIDTLERKRVRHVLLLRQFIRPDDPVAAYVAQHYRCSGDRYTLCARDADR